jgi:hypothetical protein
VTTEATCNTIHPFPRDVRTFLSVYIYIYIYIEALTNDSFLRMIGTKDRVKCHACGSSLSTSKWTPSRRTDAADDSVQFRSSDDKKSEDARKRPGSDASNPANASSSSRETRRGHPNRQTTMAGRQKRQTDKPLQGEDRASGRGDPRHYQRVNYHRNGNPLKWLGTKSWAMMPFSHDDFIPSDADACCKKIEERLDATACHRAMGLVIVITSPTKSNDKLQKLETKDVADLFDMRGFGINKVIAKVLRIDVNDTFGISRAIIEATTDGQEMQEIYTSHWMIRAHANDSPGFPSQQPA